MRHENGPPWAGLLQQWCQGACDDVNLQLPWPFKPLHSLGQQAFTQSTKLRARILPQQQRKKLSAEEQGDAEERALAIALSGRQKATLLEFYSPRCTLCQSLLKVVHDVERREGDWLNIVMADVENKKWLPEASLYEINYVPCFVLLDLQGTALAKTGVPYSRVHVLKGLSYLLESMRPIRGGLKRVPVSEVPSVPADS